jgi:hypothetical protein
MICNIKKSIWQFTYLTIFFALCTESVFPYFVSYSLSMRSLRNIFIKD